MIAGGGGFGLTIEQPENNIMRGAYYALIAALGGAQTMALCCYDEAYTIPTPKAQRISLRTMQLLIEEMGLTDTVDPLGGSYYVETLTNQMEQKIVETMQWVDARGRDREGRCGWDHSEARLGIRLSAAARARNRRAAQGGRELLYGERRRKSECGVAPLRRDGRDGADREPSPT